MSMRTPDTARPCPQPLPSGADANFAGHVIHCVVWRKLVAQFWACGTTTFSFSEQDEDEDTPADAFVPSLQVKLPDLPWTSAAHARGPRRGVARWPRMASSIPIGSVMTPDSFSKRGCGHCGSRSRSGQLPRVAADRRVLVQSAHALYAPKARVSLHTPRTFAHAESTLDTSVWFTAQADNVEDRMGSRLWPSTAVRHVLL